MPTRLYNYPVNQKHLIMVSTILKHDIAPWLASVVSGLVIFYIVVFLVYSAAPNMGIINASAYLLSYAAIFYYVLILGVCICARRSMNFWTWLLAAMLIVFFVQQPSWTFASTLLPNSIFPALSVMLGILAFGRMVEYIHFRWVMKIDGVRLSSASLIVYLVLIVQAFLLNSPYILRLLA